MHGWELKFKKAGKRNYQKFPDRIECRKSFSGSLPDSQYNDFANVLLTVWATGFTLSMNSPAHIDVWEFNKMAEVVSYAQDCLHKEIMP